MFLAVSSSPACDRAAYYLAKGEYAAALRQLEGVRAAGSSTAANENMRGLAMMLAGDPKGAITVFDGVIAADPSMLEARFNRGVALLKTGQNAMVFGTVNGSTFDAVLIRGLVARPATNKAPAAGGSTAP